MKTTSMMFNNRFKRAVTRTSTIAVTVVLRLVMTLVVDMVEDSDEVAVSDSDEYLPEFHTSIIIIITIIIKNSILL